MAGNTWDSDRAYHESLVSSADSSGAADQQRNVHREEIRTTPLFSADVLAHVSGTQTDTLNAVPDVLPQYGFLAKVLNTFGGHDGKSNDDLLTSGSDDAGVALNPNSQSSATDTGDSRLFVNMNSPWSTFICGSQGSGKSHTLSCMLEAALKPSRLGKLPSPLPGMIFHYDKFTGFSESQVCEAAYLCSTGIPVTVLVSSSNFYRMRTAYERMPKLPPNAPKPVVAPLLLEEKHLNVERMMKLMAIDEKEGKISLYMEVSDEIEPCLLGVKLIHGQSVCRILRTMAMRNHNTAGLDYEEFTERLKWEKFNDGQRAMLDTRLELLESFMRPPGVTAESVSASQVRPKHANTKKEKAQRLQWQNKDDARERAKIAKDGIWSFPPGSLTIVDLSCPFVDESAACAMFNICLALFLEDRREAGRGAGRIVALDEAHKVRDHPNMPSEMHDTEPF